LASKLIKALISFDLPGNHNLLVGGSNPSAATIFSFGVNFLTALVSGKLP
jgi:hypothetical protein